MNANTWDAYETDRAYILKLLGFSSFECDNYAHTHYLNLPKKVKEALEQSNDKPVAERCAMTLPVDESKGKFTPGPWEVSRDAVPEWHKQFTVHSERGERVATVFLDDANARLIAAAPDLLAALRTLVSTIDKDACSCAERSWYGEAHDTSCPLSYLDDAEAAIAKATRP